MISLSVYLFSIVPLGLVDEPYAASSADEAAARPPVSIPLNLRIYQHGVGTDDYIDANSH